MENHQGSPKKPVTAERAVRVLKKHGVKVSLAQAQKILEFMNVFARIAVNRYVK
jgi:hypothetical protein